MLHSLIVVPFYFFTALSLSALLILLARILRLNVAINTLVVTAVLTALLTMIVLLSNDSVSVEDLTGRRMLVLGLISFGLAGLDAALMKSMPHTMDQELDVEL